MPNGISYSLQLDHSISIFRVVGWHFSFFFQILKETSVCKQWRTYQTPLLRRLIWFCVVCRCPIKNDTRLIWVNCQKFKKGNTLNMGKTSPTDRENKSCVLTL